MGEDIFATTDGSTPVSTKTVVDGGNLPPPPLSKDEIDRLLRTLATTADASSTSTPQQPQQNQKHTLKGREVLVPVFGNIAFYDGELLPETRPGLGSSDHEKDEIVYVSTFEAVTANGARQRTENDTAPVSLSDAINWLRKYSTLAEASSEPAVATTKAVGPSTPTLKPNPPLVMNTTTTSPPPSREPDSYDEAPAGPMFNITEEYAADGTRIIAEAVNLSSRLHAVYGDEPPPSSNSNYGAGEESKTEAEDAPFDPTLVAAEKETTAKVTKGPSPKGAVSDEEYDRIAVRLEKLALLEEEETKRVKEGRRKPAKPLGGGGAPAGVGRKAKPKPKSSSFGFQKGFLNNNNTSAGKKKKPKVVANASASAKPLSKSFPVAATATAGSTTANGDGLASKPSSGVTIDVSQNKVHEIPREGRQQPVPGRKPPPQDQHQPIHTNNSNRLLDSSVFSGQVSERQQQQQKFPMATTSLLPARTISADVAARVAANEQTQSLQHELQQQQRQTRPKRVSRFKQQRQEEQQ